MWNLFAAASSPDRLTLILVDAMGDSCENVMLPDGMPVLGAKVAVAVRGVHGVGAGVAGTEDFFTAVPTRAPRRASIRVFE